MYRIYRKYCNSEPFSRCCGMPDKWVKLGFVRLWIKYFQIHRYFSCKMWVAFAMHSHFFSIKISMYLHISRQKFNVTLANNFVKFWTTGPWKLEQVHAGWVTLQTLVRCCILWGLIRVYSVWSDLPIPILSVNTICILLHMKQSVSSSR